MRVCYPPPPPPPPPPHPHPHLAGLGYYRRARYLLDGAQHVMRNLGGALPTTARELQGIPGVGPYTSAAIASIACGERAAVVDGNVVRVLARLRRLAGDPRSGGWVRWVRWVRWAGGRAGFMWGVVGWVDGCTLMGCRSDCCRCSHCRCC